jgi:DNA polymerase-3 subunit epsilon
MSWWEQPVASLDFETTGVDNRTARPVQIALAIVAPDGTVIRQNSEIVDPECEIPAGASAVHGITADRVVGKRKAREVIPRLVSLFEDGGAAHGLPLVIFNVPYDWPLLHHEARRHGLAVEARPMLLDPLLLDRTFDKYRKGSRKLSAVAANYRIKLENAHQAKADAMASALILFAMARKYPDLRKMTLADLQMFQANSFEVWKKGINSYWESKNKTDRVEGSWPGI